MRSLSLPHTCSHHPLKKAPDSPSLQLSAEPVLVCWSFQSGLLRWDSPTQQGKSLLPFLPLLTSPLHRKASWQQHPISFCTATTVAQTSLSLDWTLH